VCVCVCVFLQIDLPYYSMHKKRIDRWYFHCQNPTENTKNPIRTFRFFIFY